jgi:hypothetical protein
MSVTGLKGFNQSFVDNIIADSSHNAGVWVGESGGLGGIYTVKRNIFFNFSQTPACGGGEYSQAESSLCYRDMPMIATSTIGELLNANCNGGVCGNVSAPAAAKKACVNPDWYGFSPTELDALLLDTVDANVYNAPLDGPVRGLSSSLVSFWFVCDYEAACEPFVCNHDMLTFLLLVLLPALFL